MSQQGDGGAPVTTDTGTTPPAGTEPAGQVAPGTETAPSGQEPAASGITEQEAVDLPDSELAKLPDSWQSEVKRLRKENADRRNATKRYQDAFTGYEDDEVDIFLELARDLASADPRAQAMAAQQLQTLSEAILGGQPDPAQKPTEAGDGQPDPNAPLTWADWKRLQEEGENKKYADELRSTAEKLGYTRGTPAYNELLARAQFFNGDLEKAHESRESEKQDAIQAFIKERQGDVQNSPLAGGSAGMPANQTNPAKTLEEARARAEARLAAADRMPGR